MRREKDVTIAKPADGSENRDAGKKFHIVEMDAVSGEDWALRALGAMMRAGLPVSEEMLAGGLAAFALFGLKALMMAPHAETKPLFDEMMACVQIIEPAVTRPLLPTDIEEIGTRLRLRDEVIALHVGFSPAVVLWAAAQAAAVRAQIEASSPTPTSRKGSGRPSRRGSRRSPNSKAS